MKKIIIEMEESEYIAEQQIKNDLMERVKFLEEKTKWQKSAGTALMRAMDKVEKYEKALEAIRVAAEYYASCEESEEIDSALAEMILDECSILTLFKKGGGNEKNKEESKINE